MRQLPPADEQVAIQLWEHTPPAYQTDQTWSAIQQMVLTGNQSQINEFMTWAVYQNQQQLKQISGQIGEIQNGMVTMADSMRSMQQQMTQQQQQRHQQPAIAPYQPQHIIHETRFVTHHSGSQDPWSVLSFLYAAIILAALAGLVSTALSPTVYLYPQQEQQTQW